MANATKLTAASRDRAGKGMARETRRQGRVPAVIYGGKQPPVMISLDAAVIGRIAGSSNFSSHIFEIELEGATHRVLPRDVQFHPVTDRALHVDFLRIGADSVVTLAVPFEFVNVEASPGLKRGGVLNIVHHELEIRCRPDQIPAHFTIDLAGLEIGASIHLSSIKFGEGVTVVSHEKDFTIATIASPSALRGKDEEAVGEPAPAEAAKTT